MNSCEFVSLVTALSCGIAKCVPNKDLPLLISVLSQTAATLATFVELEGRANPEPSASFLPPISELPADDILTSPLP